MKRAASMLGLIVLMGLTLAGSASAECGQIEHAERRLADVRSNG